MNNEEKILAALGTMQSQMDNMQSEQRKTNERLDGIDARLDGIDVRLDGIERDQIEMKKELIEMGGTLNAVFDHTAQLTERHTSVERDVQELTSVVNEHSVDIMRLRAAR